MLEHGTFKNRRVSLDTAGKRVPMTLKLKRLKGQSDIREASPLFSTRVKVDNLSSTLQQKDITLQSIAIPDQTKSRKLQELIENQAKKFKLPALKPLNHQLLPVTEDKEAQKTPLCSLAMKRRISVLKGSNNLNNSRALYCTLIINM